MIYNADYSSLRWHFAST